MNHWVAGHGGSIEADDWVGAAPLDQRGRLCDLDALNTSSLVVRSFERKLCAAEATTQSKLVKFRNGPGKSAYSVVYAPLSTSGPA
jgi:hypothetical protein